MNRRFTALFLGLIFFIQIFFLSGFSVAYAVSTEDDVAKILSTFKSSGTTSNGVISDTDNTRIFNAYQEIVMHYYNLLKDDPDVSPERLQIYALEDLAKLIQYLKDKSAGVTSSGLPADLNYLSSLTVTFLTEFTKGSDGQKNAALEITFINELKNRVNNRDLTNAGVMTPEQALAANAQGSLNTTATVAGLNEANNKCSLDPGTWIYCLDALITYLIKTILLNFVTIFTWMFGMMFHYSIYFGVLNFKLLAGGSTDSPLLEIWSVIRSLVNLVMVFFGFGLAILYAANKGDKLKAFIPWLIVYALFVNFSWMISRTVVDYSNVATLKMYEIAVPGALENTGLSFTGKSAATAIMEQLGLQTLIQKVTSGISATGVASTDSNKDFEDKIKSTPVALMYVLMAGYLAYAFLVGAIIFAMRSVLLISFMIFSPFLLVDVALPWVGEYADKARKLFYSQLAVGFIFMMFLFVAIKAMGAINIGLKAIENNKAALAKTAAAGTVADVSPGIVSFFGLLVMLIFIHIMLKSVKALSPMVGNMASVAAGAAIGIASGGTAFAARATIGSAASRLAGSKALDRIQHTAIGRGIKGASNRVANSSMDLRNLSSVQSFAKKGGIQTGQSKIGGFNKDFELKSVAISDKAKGITDDVAREKFLKGQGAAAGLYTLERDKRQREFVKKYSKATGGEKQEMFNKNADLRNVALEKDKIAAIADNKARPKNPELDDYKKKREEAGYDQRNRDRGHEEYAADSAKNWSEKAPSNNTGSIDFDASELKAIREALQQNKTAAGDLKEALVKNTQKNSTPAGTPTVVVATNQPENPTPPTTPTPAAPAASASPLRPPEVAFTGLLDANGNPIQKAA